VTDIGTVNSELLVQKNFENLDASGLNGSVQATGSAGANIIIGSNGVDSINGGAGNDTLDGGAGDDALNGGDGNDVILIGAAADHGAGEVINGGAGADVIRFTSTSAGQTLVLASGITTVESVVIGTAAGLTTGTTALNVDASNVATGLTLTGNAGANVLTGTSGNDSLNGGAGDDTLNGGAGTNTLSGGTGNDRYIVAASTNVVSEGLNAGTDTVSASSLTYTLTANVENLELIGGALTGTGNTLANMITGNSGANTLSGLAGNDTLSGGAGQDTVSGGLGNDTIVMLVTAGNVDTIDAGAAGTDTLLLSGVVGGNGVVVVDLSLADQVVSIAGDPARDTLTQTGFENLDASGLGSSVNATGSAGTNLLIGSTGTDTLMGLAGNDTLDGGAGNDTLNGGTGNDTFAFGLGDGQDLVQDNSGSADKILFEGGIDPLDLVISRQANDLRIAIHGSSDQITVENWYTSSVNRTESIQAGNGELLVSAKVDQLVQAMAGFTTQTGLTWDLAIDQRPQEVQAVLAASWQ
jgi:Ca2+-binding RTX toxin-like protein